MSTLSDAEREKLIARWTQRSSDSEEERMARAERMISNAIDAHSPFDDCREEIAVYTKGSYANNTNVRLDSDVDVVVENRVLNYWDYHSSVTPPPLSWNTPYDGMWKPSKWRTEVASAISAYFGSTEVDTGGQVALTVAEKPDTRPSADVVPAFLYYCFDDAHRVFKNRGSLVFKRTSPSRRRDTPLVPYRFIRTAARRWRR